MATPKGRPAHTTPVEKGEDAILFMPDNGTGAIVEVDPRTGEQIGDVRFYEAPMSPEVQGLIAQLDAATDVNGF